MAGETAGVATEEAGEPPAAIGNSSRCRLGGGRMAARRAGRGARAAAYNLRLFSSTAVRLPTVRSVDFSSRPRMSRSASATCGMYISM